MWDHDDDDDADASVMLGVAFSLYLVVRGRLRAPAAPRLALDLL